jgi:hypothetical protein
MELSVNTLWQGLYQKHSICNLRSSISNLLGQIMLLIPSNPQGERIGDTESLERGYAGYSILGLP